MFEVKLINDDETIIHTPDNQVQRIFDADIKKETNAIDSFTFTITPDNPGYKLINPLTTRIQVKRLDRSKLLFDGRIIRPTEKMDSNSSLDRTFEADGALGYLHDSNPGYLKLTGTLENILKALLNIHNSTTEGFKHIDVGNVTSGNTLTLETTPEKDMYDTIHEFVVTTLGYEHQLVTENGVYKLNVGSDIGVQSNSKIELASNLASMEIEDDPSEIQTRLIPLGSTKSGNNNTSERVSLKDIGKKIYVDSPELIAKYGIKSGPAKIFEDVTDARQLESLAKQTLSGQRVSKKYTVSAFDLSLIDMNVDDFDVYNKYRVINPIMGLDEYLKVSAISIDINNPQNASLTIGNKFKTAADYNMINVDIDEAVKNLATQVVAGGTRLNDIDEKQQTLSSNLETTTKNFNQFQLDQNKLNTEQRDINEYFLTEIENLKNGGK